MYTNNCYQTNGVSRFCEKHNINFIENVPGTFGKGMSFVGEKNGKKYVISFNRRKDWTSDWFPYASMHKNKEVFDMVKKFADKFIVIETNDSCTRCVYAKSSEFVDGGFNMYGQAVMELDSPNERIRDI